MLNAVVDPDLQIGGGRGREVVMQTLRLGGAVSNVFFHFQFGLKIKGGPGPSPGSATEMDMDMVIPD